MMRLTEFLEPRQTETRGLGIFTKHRILNGTFIPMVGIPMRREEELDDKRYFIDAAYIHSPTEWTVPVEGNPKLRVLPTVPGLVINGKPSLLTGAGYAASWTFGMLVNEASPGEKVNCELVVNPLLTRDHIEAARLARTPVIAAYLVVAHDIRKGDKKPGNKGLAAGRELLTHYGHSIDEDGEGAPYPVMKRTSMPVRTNNYVTNIAGQLVALNRDFDLSPTDLSKPPMVCTPILP
jgi:hypothetical protein